MISKILSILAALFSVINSLLSWYEKYQLEGAIRKEVLLDQRQKNLMAKEIADAIDAAPIRRDKLAILSGM